MNAAQHSFTNLLDLECLACATSGGVLEVFSTQDANGTFIEPENLKIDVAIPASLVDKLIHFYGNWQRDDSNADEFLITHAKLYIPVLSASQSKLYDTFTVAQRDWFYFPSKTDLLTEHRQRRPVTIFSRADFPGVVFVSIEASHRYSSGFCIEVDCANKRLCFEVGKEFESFKGYPELYLELLESCLQELSIIEKLGLSKYARDIEKEIPAQYRKGFIMRKLVPMTFTIGTLSDDNVSHFIESYGRDDITYTEFESTSANYLNIAAAILRVFYPHKAHLNDMELYHTCSDGRCGELLTIDANSVDEFQRICLEMSGLHPWEIIRSPRSLDEGLHLRPLFNESGDFELLLMGGKYTSFYPRIINALNWLCKNKGIYLRCLRNNLIAFAQQKDLVLISNEDFETRMHDSNNESPILNKISFDELTEMDETLVSQVEFSHLEVSFKK